jgi:enoyl-CoA hydratase
MDDWLSLDGPKNGVTTITLQRPPVNALTPEFLQDFKARLLALEADPNTRAILIHSAFGVFSAGLDLKAAQHFDLAAQHAIVKGLNEAFTVYYALSKPTIVAVNGPAIAGGLFFVLGADYRLATKAAAFGLAEVRVGADFPIGPLEIARSTLSDATARRLMQGGQPITAKAARREGIVDEIVKPDDLMARTIATAERYAAIPPGTYASVKNQLRQDTVAKIEAAMAAGANAPETGWFNAETVPAMQAMVGVSPKR